MPLRCVIVDDNAKFLEAARFLLEHEGLDVVGIASSSADAVSRVDELRPDLALIDIQLGEENGFELAERLSGNHRGRRCLPSRLPIWGSYRESAYRLLASRDGVRVVMM